MHTRRAEQYDADYIISTRRAKQRNIAAEKNQMHSSFFLLNTVVTSARNIESQFKKKIRI